MSSTSENKCNAIIIHLENQESKLKLVSIYSIQSIIVRIVNQLMHCVQFFINK